MFHTAELRWVIAGEMPTAMEAWFAGSRDLPAVRRVDSYLVFPGIEGVGVKLREGRLEIKVRQGEGEPVTLVPGIRGRLERWVKWSAFLGTARDLVTGAPTRWTDVEKTRRLRRFAVRGTTVVETAADQQGVATCSVELARVALGRIPWWTLAIEAFPDPAASASTAVAVAHHLLAADSPPAALLAEDRALSYPAWLCRTAG